MIRRQETGDFPDLRLYSRYLVAVLSQFRKKGSIVLFSLIYRHGLNSDGLAVYNININSNCGG